jgi:hypothetical protein
MTKKKTWMATTGAAMTEPFFTTYHFPVTAKLVPAVHEFCIQDVNSALVFLELLSRSRDLHPSLGDVLLESMQVVRNP